MASLSAKHPAAHSLRDVVERLTCGSHPLSQQHKATTYQQARDEASWAAAAVA